MVEPALPQPVLRPRAVPEIIVDRVWRFFYSVHAAVFEIAFLASLVLIGSLRGCSVPRTIADSVPALTPLIDRWYAWEVFQSIPFNRAPGIWQAIALLTVETTHGFLRNADTSVRFEAASDVDSLANQIKSILQKKGYRTLSTERSGELHLYAERLIRGR